MLHYLLRSCSTSQHLQCNSFAHFLHTSCALCRPQASNFIPPHLQCTSSTRFLHKLVQYFTHDLDLYLHTCNSPLHASCINLYNIAISYTILPLCTAYTFCMNCTSSPFHKRDFLWPMFLLLWWRCDNFFCLPMLNIEH